MSDWYLGMVIDRECSRNTGREDCISIGMKKKKRGVKNSIRKVSVELHPSILFGHTTHTSHRSRRPLVEALGGSSPESSITPDARSVTCVCRMMEKNGRVQFH